MRHPAGARKRTIGLLILIPPLLAIEAACSHGPNASSPSLAYGTESEPFRLVSAPGIWVNLRILLLLAPAVIPAKAGIRWVDPRLRGGDNRGRVVL